MKNIKETNLNIRKIEGFVTYLRRNFNEHSKTFKNSENLDDLENSLAFLKDYAEVSEKLIAVIKDYCDKTGMEV